MIKPKEGLVTKATVIKVTDGDTVKVKIERTITIRLIDCWAPEITNEEKEIGIASKKHLESIIQPGDEVTIFIPASKRGVIADELTLTRFLGRIWKGNIELSNFQVTEGYAQKDKPND